MSTNITFRGELWVFTNPKKFRGNFECQYECTQGELWVSPGWTFRGELWVSMLMTSQGELWVSCFVSDITVVQGELCSGGTLFWGNFELGELYSGGTLSWGNFIPGELWVGGTLFRGNFELGELCAGGTLSWGNFIPGGTLFWGELWVSALGGPSTCEFLRLCCWQIYHLIIFW